MKNIKQYLKLGALAGTVAAVAMMSQSAQAVLIESGTSLLPEANSSDPGYSPLNNLTVSWLVTLSGTTYTYDYVVNVPSTVHRPNGDPESVDSFEVDVDTTIAGNVIPGTVTGGVLFNIGASGITWFFNAVTPGHSSGILEFESKNPPQLGNDNAADATAPSPWSDLGLGGQPVPVPGVPDGGLTVALLGGSLVTLSIFNRKRR